MNMFLFNYYRKIGGGQVMRDFNHLNLSLWQNAFFDEVDERVREAARKHCPDYKRLVKEAEEFLDAYPFIAILDGHDSITEGRTFSREELEALSDFLYAEDNQEYVERMELYLLGVRDAIALFSFLKI